MKRSLDAVPSAPVPSDPPSPPPPSTPPPPKKARREEAISIASDEEDEEEEEEEEDEEEEEPVYSYSTPHFFLHYGESLEYNVSRYWVPNSEGPHNAALVRYVFEADKSDDSNLLPTLIDFIAHLAKGGDETPSKREKKLLPSWILALTPADVGKWVTNGGDYWSRGYVGKPLYFHHYFRDDM